jgi:hypothetical protein
MKWLAKVGKKLVSLFQKDIAAKVFRAISRAAPYFDEALQVVEWAARLAGSRSPEEISRLANAAGLEKVPEPGTGDLLRMIALQLLLDRFPDAQRKDLNRAIELAVGVHDNNN